MGRTVRTLWLAIGCVCACDAPTVLRVRITTDYRVPDELEAVRVVVHPDEPFAPDPSAVPPFTLDQVFPLDRVDDRGRLLDIVPSAALGDADGRRVRIEVGPIFAPGSGCPTGVAYQAASLVGTFARGELDELPVPIVRRCCREACPELTYCLHGACAPEDGRCDARFDGIVYTCGEGVCLQEVPLCVQGEVNEVCAENPSRLDLCPIVEAPFDGDCDAIGDTMVATTLYRDLDGDGYGQDTDVVDACNPRPDYAPRPGDCDDAIPTAHPDAVEACNRIDDDCDGLGDEGFDLATDPQNCGACDRACAFPNATPRCSAGTCRLATCLTGFVDADRDPTNGCETACTPTGGEVCNRVDDDCNGSVDDGLAENCDNGIDDDCDGLVDECSIGCTWNGAIWLSHAGPTRPSTGAWFSCSGARLTYVSFRSGSGIAYSPVPSGTATARVECNFSGSDRWASQGEPSFEAFVAGSNVACIGGRVGRLRHEAARVTTDPAYFTAVGELGCDWTGAIWITHGVYSGGETEVGFIITCSANRVTGFEWVDAPGGFMACRCGRPIPAGSCGDPLCP